MRIKVKFRPVFQKRTGCDERLYEVKEGATVADLLNSLAGEYGEPFPALAQGKGLSKGVLVVHNSRVIQKVAVKLIEGDEVGFSLPLSGG